MNTTTQNKTARRKTAQMQRHFIKAMLELNNTNKAALFAAMMSLSQADKGEARLWWTVVSLLRPDVATKLDSFLRPDISKNVADVSQRTHQKTQNMV